MNINEVKESLLKFMENVWKFIQHIMTSLLFSTLSKLLDYSMVLIEMYFRAIYLFSGR